MRSVKRAAILYPSSHIVTVIIKHGSGIVHGPVEVVAVVVVVERLVILFENESEQDLAIGFRNMIHMTLSLSLSLYINIYVKFFLTTSV